MHLVCLKKITMYIFELFAVCLHEVRRQVALLLKAKVKPSKAANIRADSTVSFLATMFCFIDEDWIQIHEMLPNSTGFTRETQTGEAIRKQPVDGLQHVCLTFEHIHANLSDEG